MQSPVEIDTDGADTSPDGCRKGPPTLKLPIGMRFRGALPRFSAESFSKTVRDGLQVMEEQRREKAAMWTTPGLRPLAEPPIMPWDRILKKYFSEARLNALFAGDPEKQSRVKDLEGEMLALAEYHEWTWRMTRDEHECEPRTRFYVQLLDDVAEEGRTVEREWNDLYKTATSLGRWEFAWLDNDGKTTMIEHHLRLGKDVFQWCDEARVKYRHLLPIGNDARPLGIIEYDWMDERRWFDEYGSSASTR